MSDTRVLEEGYAKARETYGGRYADYLVKHDEELVAKGRQPKPWPLSLQGNDGD